MSLIINILKRTNALKRFLANIEAMASRIRALEEHVAALEAKYAELEKHLAALEAKYAELEKHLAALDAKHAELSRQSTSTASQHKWLRARSFAQTLGLVHPDFVEGVLIARRAEQMVVLPLNEAMTWLSGASPEGIVMAAAAGELLEAVQLVRVESGWRPQPLVGFVQMIKDRPLEALAWLEEQPQKGADDAEAAQLDYFARLDVILADIDRIDFYAFHCASNAGEAGTRITPFDVPAKLPPLAPATPQKRSALFLHNNYYHYNCLAAGLKARGWDTVTVSLESPDSPQRQFFHGEDINLFDPDPARARERVRDFFRTVPERYLSLHFHGMGMPTFFQDHIENSSDPIALPWDFLELRRHRTIIGYMPSGCLDGGLQSSVHALTGGLCDRCIWQTRPDICNDARSLVWNRKLVRLCDWVGLECDHATPERISSKTVYGPVVTALDPARWRPDIEPPEAMRIERAYGEVLIYHAVGNYQQRRSVGRDIKGTEAIMAAVEQIKKEGLSVRLVFAHDIPSTQVRYLQVQADIVVDQLNYGRYGASARESLMLGKPTICKLSPRQASPLPPLRPIDEVPIINADETNIADVLRALVLDPHRRADLGRRARAFALAWHGQDACAERYERVINRIHAGLPPEAPDLYPPEQMADAWLT